MTLGVDFTNDGTVNGTGQYLFSGNTRTQGAVTGDAGEPDRVLRHVADR